jgi:hypothetical protein
MGAGPGANMLVLPNGNFLPSGPMGPGMRMPGQFGGLPPNPFEQQHFDPNIAALGQRQSDFDFKRGPDGRISDPKRPRN